MDSQTIVLIEVVLVFGLIVGWGVWELRKLKRERAADAAAEQASATKAAEASTIPPEAAELKDGRVEPHDHARPKSAGRAP